MKKKIFIAIICIIFIMFGIFIVKSCNGKYKDVLYVEINGQRYSTTYQNGNGWVIGSCEEIQCKEANGMLYVRYKKNGKWYEFSVKDSESEYYVRYS